VKTTSTVTAVESILEDTELATVTVIEGLATDTACQLTSTAATDEHGGSMALAATYEHTP
jgi:hypothetical protein